MQLTLYVLKRLYLGRLIYIYTYVYVITVSKIRRGHKLEGNGGGEHWMV